MHLAKLSLPFLQFQIVESVQCSTYSISLEYFFQADILMIPKEIKTTNAHCQVPSSPVDFGDAKANLLK